MTNLPIRCSTRRSLSSRSLRFAVLALAVLAIPHLARAGTLESFTLPSPAPGSGIYKPDVQASHPGVNWSTLDRLYIPAGHYPFIRLGNLPLRDAARPLVITNSGGQVRVGGLGHYYLFVIGGGSHWKLTGRYDVDDATGHASFPGHEAGYANSQGTYGIVVDDEYAHGGNSGLAIGSAATDFEVEFLEIARVDFAGMLIKTDDDGAALMNNVKLHDLYIHDTLSEGIYLGSTQGGSQHAFENLEITNNRVLRTGTESRQLGQLGDGSRVHHNVFMFSAIDWKNPFQAFQDNGSQIGVRYGDVEIDHNVFIGGASNFFQFFPQPRGGDSHNPGDRVWFHHNVFSHTRGSGIYFHNYDVPNTTYLFEDNVFRARDFQYDELNPSATDGNTIFVHFNDDVPIELRDNVVDGPEALINNHWANVTLDGNLQTATEPFQFVDSGFPHDFDYLRLEIWTHLDRFGMPVFFHQGDFVLENGDLYECIQAGSHTNQRPSENPGTWVARPAPADDVRSHNGALYRDIGLADAPIFVDGFESGGVAEWGS